VVGSLAAIAAAGRFYYPDAALRWMRLYAMAIDRLGFS
jgi:hypothetical protein